MLEAAPDPLLTRVAPGFIRPAYLPDRKLVVSGQLKE